MEVRDAAFVVAYHCVAWRLFNRTFMYTESSLCDERKTVLNRGKARYLFALR
jgi:hypothetical protein